MKKKHYQKELKISRTAKMGSKGKNVDKIQEWLNLWRIYEGYDIINVTRDSVFGRETDYAIKQFQEIKQLPANGIVDDYIFSLLSAPILNAYAPIDKTGTNSFKDLIIPYAKQHLKANPREFKSNLGPWVRSYTNGNQGAQWAWCVGFVTTILDLACSTHGLKFTDIVPHTLSCDILGEHARKNMRLIRNKDIAKSLDIIQPGDIFLLHGKNKYDWWHTGIIQEVYDTYFKTIEGNTNDEGVREGFEVCGRVRFHQYLEKKLDNVYMDVVRIEDKSLEMLAHNESFQMRGEEKSQFGKEAKKEIQRLTKEAEERKTLKTAKKLKKLGVDTIIIVKSTGLTTKQVEQL